MAEYVSDIPGLAQSPGEYADIDELNHLARLLSELNESELDIFSAAVSAGEHTASVGDLINLVHNIDCYDFHRGVTDDETLGHIYVEDMELLDVPEHILPYFDFEAYGRDARINENGCYVNGGYLIRSGDSFEEVYHSKEDIPKEQRVFAYPSVPIREQMAYYREAARRCFPRLCKEQQKSDREER